MVEPLRHRQTKGAETDMLSLTPPRHVSTLPTPAVLWVSERRRSIAAKIVAVTASARHDGAVGLQNVQAVVERQQSMPTTTASFFC